MNTALEYSTRVVQEGGHRSKKSILNDLVNMTPLRIPLMNPPNVRLASHHMKHKITAISSSFTLLHYYSITITHTLKALTDHLVGGSRVYLFDPYL
jgi:hypothetical protein